MSDQPPKPENTSDRVEKTEQNQVKTTFKPKLRHILGMVFLGVVLSGAAARTLQIIGQQKSSTSPIAQNPNASIPSYDRNGFPNLNPPVPTDAEVWECDVAIVGGSLGVAAAYHSMKTGATTCLIELTPMLGGQVSSQGLARSMSHY